MNSREEKDQLSRSNPRSDLESPFLAEELFVKEAEPEVEARLAALEAESPFQNAFDRARTSLIKPEELKEEFVIEKWLPSLPRPSLQPVSLSHACQEKLKSTSVAVVGGGFAGLMAARRLRQQGIKVTVFEARSQVGGRVRSNYTFSNGRITEEGAELIGSFHTTWLALARKYGLAMINRMDKDLYEREGLDVKLTLDQKLSMDEIKKLDEAMEIRVLEPIAKLASQIQHPSQPWLEPWLEQYDKMSVADALAKKPVARDAYGVGRNERLWKYIEFKLVNDEVSPLDEMNFLGLLCKVRAGQYVRFSSDGPDPKKCLQKECLSKERLMSYWNELEIFRCADGCQTLANRMADEIRKYGSDILLKTAVTHIALSKQRVVLGSKKVVNEKTGELADKPNPLLIYDYVILAIPPSVWDAVTITTADRRDSHPKDGIGVMGMNPAVKFFSDVKKRFWIEEKAAPSGGSLKIGQVWEGTDNQTCIPGSKQGIVLSVFAGPIVPISLVPGKASRRAPNPDEFDEGLRELYRGYTKQNLNKIRFSNWPREPFIKTGYASPRKGEIFTIGQELSKPWNNRLFFSGEHTQMDFFGYMEGALRSGERAANMLILQACGQQKEPSPASSKPPMITASTAPIRAKTASEYETEIPLEEHPATDYPGEAESPFLDRDLFAAGAEEELEAETPFRPVFEQSLIGLNAPQEEEESFEEDEFTWERDEFPGDKAEAYDIEALADLEDSVEDLYGEEARYADAEAEEEEDPYIEATLSLEEEPFISEETGIEPEDEEVAYPLKESTYAEDEPSLDEGFYTELESELEYEEQELDARLGKTLYLPIHLNKTVPPKVGVFIPSSLKLAAPFNIIVYFHGHMIPQCEKFLEKFKQDGIEHYWNTPLFKGLREELTASGQQAILIAPTLLPFLAQSQHGYGDLYQDGKFDYLINEILKNLKEKGALPAGAQVRNIILSGHSGGGLPMQKILGARNTLNEKIIECWGFESLYFGTLDWERWLKADRNHHFYHFRRRTFKEDETKILKNHPNFTDVNDGTDHCRLLMEKWRQAIDTSPVFHGGSKPAKSPTAGAPASDLLSRLAGLPGLASLPSAFLDYLAKGMRDENQLTDLIFYDRHRGLGRKLTSSDPQSLKDEWVSILRTIVRPALDRLKQARSASSAGSVPEKRLPLPSAPALPRPEDDKFTLTEWKLETTPIEIARWGDKKKGKSVIVKQAPAVFLPAIIAGARDRALRQKKNDLAQKLDPATWFKKFTRVTFLGRRLCEKQYLHLEIAKLLKGIESEMVRKYGADAKSVGDALLKGSQECIAGSRLVSSTATFSMHMFGVAVDVNYCGNPYIETERDIQTLNNVLRNAALLMNQPVLVYKKGYAKDKFDQIQRLDDVLEKYFSLLDAPAELERLVRESSSSDWSGLSRADAWQKIQKNLDNLAGLLARGDTRDHKRKDYFKQHAILNFDKRFVMDMEKMGLSWGGHYGDMMHFDMRSTGVGAYIQEERLDYLVKARQLAKHLYDEGKYGTRVIEPVELQEQYHVQTRHR